MYNARPPLLEVVDLLYAYGQQAVINGVTFSLTEGTIACLLGPSGCGKSTLMRCIAGFEPLQHGSIRINGKEVSSRSNRIAPEHRKIGMVFQDYALFPHLNAARNIALALAHRPASERARCATELLATVGLGGLADRFPHQLSGGQQQRVALARALASSPRLVLLDEPFSSLDMTLRQQLASEIRTLLKTRGIAAILVTHDQNEAFAFADEIGVMHDGRLLQWGRATDLFDHPADRFVANFVGQGCFLQGTVESGERVLTEIGPMRLSPKGYRGQMEQSLAGGSAVDVLLRPDAISIDPDSNVQALVASRTYRGLDTLYGLKLPSGAQVLCQAGRNTDYAVGSVVGIRPRDVGCTAFRRS